MDFKIDINPGDTFYSMQIEAGDIKITDLKEEIKQRVIFNLKTFKGENLFYSTSGTDYVRNVFPYEAEDITLQDEFKRVMLGTTGVLSINSFSVTQERETLKVNASLSTEDGEIKISEDV